MGFLAGKKLLITGVLSNRSIAYGIAKACHAQGAELAFSYVGERFKDRITEFAADFDSKLVFDCDVGDDAQIENLFRDLSAHWPKFDGFAHAIGYAPREAIAAWMGEAYIYQGDPAKVVISDAETDYLLQISNSYFRRKISRQDIRHSYAGVRPLLDDEADSAQAVTRDYKLELDAPVGAAPLLSIFASVSVVSGIVGSSSGGLQIFMQTLAPKYLEMGVEPEVLHRIANIAAGGLDSLPHCGAVIAMLMIMGLTHKQAYKDIFMVTVLIPVVAVLACIAVLSLF